MIQLDIVDDPIQARTNEQININLFEISENLKDILDKIDILSISISEINTTIENLTLRVEDLENADP